MESFHFGRKAITACLKGVIYGTWSPGKRGEPPIDGDFLWLAS